MKDRKVCVVGAGRWGKNHIKTLYNLGKLGGIVESDPQRREEMKVLYPDIKFFPRVQDSLEIDYAGYTIATPAETHYDLAKYLLTQKKHVLVEKPITLHAFEARELRKLAREYGVNLMAGHLLLFHPAIKKIKEILDSGTLGKLEYLYSNRLNLGTVRTEENILWSFAPHDISIFQFLIDAYPEEIVSKGGIFLQPGIHDTTLTILKYPDNVIGHIFVSWLHPFKEHRLVVIGSKGMLSFDDSHPEKKLLFYEKGIDWIQGEPIRRDGPTDEIEYGSDLPLTAELRYFTEHLDGSRIEIADAQNAVEVLEILEKATNSLQEKAEEKKEIKIPQDAPYFVHESSYVDENVRIGEGTKVWHFSHIQSGSVIGRKCSIGQNVNVGNNVKIGDYVKIQNNVSVYEGVELEDYVFCGPSMVFTNVIDPRSKYPQRGSEFYRKTLVKEGASIGANATIVCGNTIGRHAFIGAGAVVTRDVPDFALIVGIPGRIRGWVCECGESIDFEDKENTSCKRCGLKYIKESDSKIRQITEKT